MNYIAKKYCKENLVQLMHKANMCNFIVSPDEIILLKNNGDVVVNNYRRHPKRMLFPFSEKTMTNGYFHELFEYNKPYLNFSGELGGYRFGMDYFVKDEDEAILYESSLPVDRRTIDENEIELSRSEVEEIFDKNLYDGIYVIDVSGRIIFANNKVNGLVIDKKIVPDDEEIKKLDVRHRIYEQDMKIIARRIAHAYDEEQEKEIKEEILPRDISKIKDLNIYSGGLFNDYHHMLLTSKDGNFSLKFFKLKYIEKDKFKFTYHDIPVILPNPDTILMHAHLDNIEYTHEPYIKYKDNEEIKKEDKKPTVQDNSNANEKDKGIKKLIRIFKRNK